MFIVPVSSCHAVLYIMTLALFVLDLKRYDGCEREEGIGMVCEWVSEMKIVEDGIKVRTSVLLRFSIEMSSGGDTEWRFTHVLFYLLQWKSNRNPIDIDAEMTLSNCLVLFNVHIQRDIESIAVQDLARTPCPTKRNIEISNVCVVLHVRHTDGIFTLINDQKHL